MLSANVVLSGSDQLLAEPYTVLDLPEFRVGIIGLTRMPSQPGAGFQVLDPQEAAARYVPQVAGQTDTVILLTNASYRQGLELAQIVPGIDLLIAALPGKLPDRVVRIPETGTVVVSAELPLPRHTGRRVGRLVVTVEHDGDLSIESWATVPMGNKIADDPQMQALLDEYRH
jgi:2',3'-cyclic-nucleotide 2'-phosphodiesterase (5'-nucleotidase family)